MLELSIEGILSISRASLAHHLSIPRGGGHFPPTYRARMPRITMPSNCHHRTHLPAYQAHRKYWKVFTEKNV